MHWYCILNYERFMTVLGKSSQKDL
ncbi:hypothetical protein EMIT051CA3_40420 [Pseudomonas chlororaphis]